MPVNNMPARTFDHKYSAPRSSKSSGELAFKLARDEDKENGAAKGQSLSPSKIIKGVRGRAVGTPTSHSVEWPHAVRGHSAGAFGSSSSGPASSELANSLDSLAGISNIQDMSPDFLEALVALREEHTRRLAAIEGQYYGSSTFVGSDDAAGAADEESRPAAAAPRAHSGGSAVEASGGRPVSTSAAGRKADGLFPASAKAAASAALPPRPSSARARAPSPSIRDFSDNSLPTRARPSTAHARPSSLSIGGDAASAATASAVADIIGAQSSSDEDEPLFENLNARASSALHSELSPRSRAFAHKVTVPEAPAFLARQATAKKCIADRRFEAEMLQRQREEEAHHRFVIRPLPVPTSTIEPRFQLLQDKNKRRSESIKRDSMEKLKATQRPFSFVAADAERAAGDTPNCANLPPNCSRTIAAKAKAVAEREAAEAAVFHFRAKDVPDRIRESKSIDFEAEEKKREDERKTRIKQAAAAKCAAAALPPRMQARMEQEKDGGSGHGAKAVAPEHSFAPEINGVVPDFASRHARSEAQLEAVKAKLAAEKKAIVIKAFELRSDRVYWSKIAPFEGFYSGASVDEGVQEQSLAALGLEAGCSQWSLLCALRSKVGGRDYLMREVFEEFRVMPPGNLQVLADAERDKVTGKEMRWPYCARSEERHGLTSVITPRLGSGDVGPPPQPVNPDRTPVKKAGTTRTAELRQKLAAEAKAADEERAAREQREADKLKDPSHPANVHRRLWKELMRLLQQASNEQLGKKEDGPADALPAHARNLRIAEIKLELGMVEKDKADNDAEEDVLAATSSSDVKLKPRLTMIEQQSLLAVKQKKDKAVSDVLRKFKMSDLDEPLAVASAAKGSVTPRKK